MSTKSRTSGVNGQTAPTGGNEPQNASEPVSDSIVPPGVKQPTDRPRSQADRIVRLEQENEALKAAVRRIEAVIGGMLENQAVQAAMPAVEKQIRNGFQQRFQQGGLAALLNAEATPPQ